MEILDLKNATEIKNPVDSFHSRLGTTKEN